MLLDLPQPGLDIGEGLHVRAVIDQYDAHGSFVVGLCDRPKSFLAGCVPDLELDSFVVDVNFLDLKVYPYLEV